MIKNRHFDVIIVGGGIIGSSIAYFIADQTGSSCSILVVEKDPGYSQCSTTLSVGGIRQQFSTRENIEISKFGTNFIKSVKDFLSVENFVPELSFKEAGYLFLSTADGYRQVKSNYELQRSQNVNVVLLSPQQLEKRYNWLNISGLSAGSFGESVEGWLDPFSLLMAFVKKAKSLGVTYHSDEVINVHTKKNRIEGLQLGIR